MSNEVSRRFVEVHDHLRATNIINSTRHLAITLDYAPQSMDLVIKGKRDAPVDLIRKLVSRYGVNAHYLFMGEGSMFFEDTDRKAEMDQSYIHTRGRIIHVPVHARAGYGDQFNDPVFLESLPTFTLPGPRFQQGEFRCFDIDGDSMEPTLSPGDRVVCSQIEQIHWINSIRDRLVYVVVTDNDVFAKRVVNNYAKEKCLELHSDNEFYAPFKLPYNQIKEVWSVEVKISGFLPTPPPAELHDDLMKELESLRSVVMDIKGETKQIQNGFNEVLKSSRLSKVGQAS